MHRDQSRKRSRGRWQQWWEWRWHRFACKYEGWQWRKKGTKLREKEHLFFSLSFIFFSFLYFSFIHFTTTLLSLFFLSLCFSPFHFLCFPGLTLPSVLHLCSPSSPSLLSLAPHTTLSHSLFFSLISASKAFYNILAFTYFNLFFLLSLYLPTTIHLWLGLRLLQDT